jgi:hypothetical protein
MTIALLVLAGGLCSFGLVLLVRFLEYRAWRGDLVAFRLQLPASLTAEDVTGWLGMLAAALHTPRRALVCHPPLVLEVVATKRGIAHYVLVSKRERAMLLTSVAAGLTGARLEEAPDYLSDHLEFRTAVELTMTSRRRPLALDRGASASTALLSTLQPLHGEERVVVQWLITGAGTPSPVRTRDGGDGPLVPWRLLAGEAPADADDLRALRQKQQAPLLYLAGRIGVSAARAERAGSLLGRTLASLRVLNAPGIQLVRHWVPSRLVSARLDRRAIPLTAYPMTMNAAEAAAAIGLPIGDSYVPGLALGASRTLPPPSSMAQRGVLVGDPTYPGLARPLMLGNQDRLSHSWLIGPTGTGKSTLIANMALQDIVAGHGVTVLDPKADLVESILSRLPEEHRDQVVVLDAASIEQPVGFNLLAAGSDEQSRELAVDNTAHILRSLYADSWGPRSDQYLRAGLMALVHARAPDGSAFTLVDLPVLLERARFRRYVLAQPTVPERVRQAWTAFEAASDAEKATIIAPLSHKLGALTLRSSLRLALGQSTGVRFDDLFRERRSLLVSLRKDAIGQDSAQLLGALLVASLWQATLRRASVPADHRRPYFVFLDEFQDVVRLPLDLADMLAQSRSLGVGLHLAHQYLDQLPKSVQTAVLGTTRTQVAFQLNHADGRTLAPLFAPLTPADLTGLPAYEIALRPCVNGTTASVATGKTRPLLEPVADPVDVAEASRARYGMPRADVEAAMQARTTPPERKGTVGRQRRGGQS